jgi:tRNA G18 (ribose-2'-O)-methylase SpoU
MPLISVTAGDDPRLADYRNVPDPELVERRGIFIAEGRLVVRRLLTESRLTTRSVMVTPTALTSIADLADARPALPVYVVTQQVMDAVSGFNIHRGCLAIGERPPRRSWPDVVRDARTVIVLERIGNADNIGGIFRNAAAFGADAVVLGPACADPLYRKAIRTSMGATLLVAHAEASPWPDALSAIRAAGLALVAMTPSAGADPLHDVAVRLGNARIAIVLGHEGEGLTTPALEACEHHARIPMSSFDSLNVASASAVALYELTAAARAW